jgi:hypothetical protein
MRFLNMRDKIRYTIFEYLGLDKYIEACDAIESDPNYQPSISNSELMSLVRYENGDSRYTPRKSALAIQPLVLPAGTSTIPENSGTFYQVKIALKSCIDDEEYPVWHINDSVVIFINKQGETTLHSSEEILKGNLRAPLTHLSINNFLGWECLHDSNPNKSSSNTI